MLLQRNIKQALKKGDKDEIREIIRKLDSGLIFPTPPVASVIWLAIRDTEGSYEYFRPLLLASPRPGWQIHLDKQPGGHPIFQSIRSDELVHLQVLQNMGAPVTGLRLDGQTPLHYAVEHNALQCLEFLVEGYPELQVRTLEGLTALELAESRGNGPAARILRPHFASSTP